LASKVWRERATREALERELTVCHRSIADLRVALHRAFCRGAEAAACDPYSVELGPLFQTAPVCPSDQEDKWRWTKPQRQPAEELREDEGRYRSDPEAKEEDDDMISPDPAVDDEVTLSEWSGDEFQATGGIYVQQAYHFDPEPMLQWKR
jgi:hypothetical protein